MRLHLALAALQAVRSEYFPSVDPSTTWQAPRMLPWDPLRATFLDVGRAGSARALDSVLVAWTPAWNPWCAVGHYEVQSRRPAGHPLSFHERERVQHREMEDDAWPGDDAWTNWSQAFSGPGRAYALRVEAGAAHAVQVRVRACGVAVATHGCSAWSAAQTAHTVLSATRDKVNIYIRGTGKNAPATNEIMVNEEGPADLSPP
ncbi:unnamed protein product [Prorocentrum cordatum]|uniref:Beta-galactosidase n=1 Tax=Prorocentrum cordatum TaxID=2364126 RepID=A0ABN9UUC5_9DINO|nr:unnamed protein product [Polarella glacialis]